MKSLNKDGHMQPATETAEASSYAPPQRAASSAVTNHQEEHHHYNHNPYGKTPCGEMIRELAHRTHICKKSISREEVLEALQNAAKSKRIRDGRFYFSGATLLNGGVLRLEFHCCKNGICTFDFAAHLSFEELRGAYSAPLLH